MTRSTPIEDLFDERRFRKRIPDENPLGFYFVKCTNKQIVDIGSGVPFEVLSVQQSKGQDGVEDTRIVYPS